MEAMTVDLPRYTLRLSRRKFPALLGVIVAAVIGAYLAALLANVDRDEGAFDIFSLNEKVSFQNAFSSFVLLAAAGLLAAIMIARARSNLRDVGHWKWLAIGFATMSLDRIACIHQLINTFSPVSWEIPGAFIVAGIGLAYIGFLRRLPARSRTRFLISGVVYVFGVIVVEALANPYMLNLTAGTTADDYMRIADEGPQMIGAVLFLFALLDYMRTSDTAGAGADTASTPYWTTISRSRIVRMLAAAGIGLIALHLAFQFYHVSRHRVPLDLHLLFDVASDSTAPNWFGAFLLALGSFLACLIARERKRAASREAWGWRTLSIGLGLLALDKPVALHDWLTLHADYEWWMPAVAAIVIGAITLFRWLMRIPVGVRDRMLAAGTIFLLGAFGMAWASGTIGAIPPDTASAAIASALSAAAQWTGTLMLIDALLRAMSDADRVEIAVEVAA